MRNPIKTRQNKAGRLWKEFCLLRDGGCQVQRYFPILAINHSEVLQVDHCFSRQIKELFLDVANGTVLCSTCNQVKGSGKIGATKRDAVTIAVHEIVKKREGIDVYLRILEIASAPCAFTSWRNIVWLDGQITILQEMIEELKIRNKC